MFKFLTKNNNKNNKILGNVSVKAKCGNVLKIGMKHPTNYDHKNKPYDRLFRKAKYSSRVFWSKGD